MKIEVINGIRVITPNDEMWLCNENDRVISDKVHLGIQADANDWSEITDERKQELEALWYEETTSGDTDTATVEDYQNLKLKAQAYDIITGGVE